MPVTAMNTMKGTNILVSYSVVIDSVYHQKWPNSSTFHLFING